jgi:hypothetical protein
MSKPDPSFWDLEEAEIKRPVRYLTKEEIEALGYEVVEEKVETK